MCDILYVGKISHYHYKPVVITRTRAGADMIHIKSGIRDRYKLRHIMDDTGDTATEGKVIIERYGQLPIVVLQSEIEETLEPYADVVPDKNYRNFHEEIQRAWDNDLPWRKSFEQEIGVLIERLKPNHYDTEGE